MNPDSKNHAIEFDGRKIAEESVTEILSMSGLPTPRLFLWFRSPREGCYAAAVLTKLPDDQDFSTLTEDFVRSLMSTVTEADYQDSSRSAMGGQIAGLTPYKVTGVDSELDAQASILNTISEHASVWWAFEGVVVLSDLPIEAHYENGVPHNRKGPSTVYADGFETWHLKGKVVPRELIMDPYGLAVSLLKELGEGMFN